MSSRSRSGTGRARIADVAAQAGVSTMTVSRAIRRPDLVSEATRERVADAVRAVGYTPDLVAQSLATNRTGMIAAVVPTLATFSETLDGVQDVLTPLGYHLFLANTQYRADGEEALVRALLGRRPDGVVLVGVSHSRHSRQLLRAAKVPIIELWDLTPQPLDVVVGFSNFDAARAMVHRLAARGRRRIAHVTGATADPTRAARRRRGYEAALAELGLGEPCSISLPGPTSYASGGAALDALAATGRPFDAVLFADDVLAAGALLAAPARGIRVPDDLAIAGFGDSDLSRCLSPALTTVCVARYDMGRRAAHVLVRRLAGDRSDGRIVDVGFEIVERGST